MRGSLNRSSGSCKLILFSRPHTGFRSPPHRVLRDMNVDRLKKEQKEARDKPERAANNVRVSREDVAAALASQEDTYPVTVKTGDDRELRQQILVADLRAARAEADLKTG